MYEFFANNDQSINGNYEFGKAIFESLNVIDYISQQSDSDRLLRMVKDNERDIIEGLKTLGRSDLSLWKNTDGNLDKFVFGNVADALGRPYQMYFWSKDKGAAERLRTQLDDALLSILQHHNLRMDNSSLDKKFIEGTSISIAVYYAKFTDRNSKDFCNSGTFAPYCEAISIDSVLESVHTCSSTLKLRTQQGKVNASQKADICRRLGVQESKFHSRMGTANRPVSGDNNKDLELVIFGSPDDWHTYGNALFGVGTDNGGIYMEGNPSAAGNQARFYAYIADWKEDFQVWNLEHEYTHYLDGRFNMYGPFNYYPENRVTWWAEGIAEYLAHGECFGRGLDNIVNAGRVPSLQEILYLNYNSGPEMVYSWSYTVHRFLNENGLSNAWHNLAQALRGTNKGNATEEFNRVLDDLIRNHSNDYNQWVNNELIPWWKSNQSTCDDHSSH